MATTAAVALLLLFLGSRAIPGAAVPAILLPHTISIIRVVPCGTLEAALWGSGPAVFCHEMARQRPRSFLSVPAAARAPTSLWVLKRSVVVFPRWSKWRRRVLSVHGTAGIPAISGCPVACFSGTSKNCCVSLHRRGVGHLCLCDGSSLRPPNIFDRVRSSDNWNFHNWLPSSGSVPSSETWVYWKPWASWVHLSPYMPKWPEAWLPLPSPETWLPWALLPPCLV